MNEFYKDCESFEQFKYKFYSIVNRLMTVFWKEFVKVWTNFQNFIENFDCFSENFNKNLGNLKKL